MMQSTSESYEKNKRVAFSKTVPSFLLPNSTNRNSSLSKCGLLTVENTFLGSSTEMPSMNYRWLLKENKKHLIFSFKSIEKLLLTLGIPDSVKTNVAVHFVSE